MAQDKIPSIDVCIFCALAEEAEAVLYTIEDECGVSFQHGFTGPYEFKYTTIQNYSGEPINVLVSWASGKGPVEAGLLIQTILSEFKPFIAAMTGICAGQRNKVKLGDIIVAESAFFYDTGKFILDSEGDEKQCHDVRTYQASTDIIQFAQMFHRGLEKVEKIPRPISKHQQRDWLLVTLLNSPSHLIDDIPFRDLESHAPLWRKIVQELQFGEMPLITKDRKLRDIATIKDMFYGKDQFPYFDSTETNRFIATVASGSAVRSDNPFANIQIPVRSAIACEMEGAVLYRHVQDFPGMRCLLVKAVCDFADNDKDDAFHKYAASASAVYLLSFIQEFLQGQRFPDFKSQKKVGYTVTFQDRDIADGSIKEGREYSKTRMIRDVEYVYISAGESCFIGSNLTLSEQPSHMIKMDPYYISRYPITIKDYLLFLHDTGMPLPETLQNKKMMNDADHPISYVSWEDAVMYCQWAGVYLPTEVQWEHACRGKDAFLYPWGNEWKNMRCNSAEMNCKGKTSVQTFSNSASPYGIIDMLGNVWEWCSTFWGSDWQSCQFPYPYRRDDREKRFEGGYRIARGGSWKEYNGIIRASYRGRFPISGKFENIGFRCVFPLQQQE